MGKSIRIILTSLLLVTLLFIGSIFIFAITIEKSPYKETKGIEVNQNPNGSLDFFKYTTSATGATSGIRYRVTHFTFKVENMNVEINVDSIISIAKPAGGKQEFYDITITGDDIIKEYERQIGRKLLEDERNSFTTAYQNPKNIDVGAYLEVYNANTGDTLERIKSISEIDSKAKKYGFPTSNLNDMKSWFSKTTVPPKPKPKEEMPKPGGLRPSVIVG